MSDEKKAKPNPRDPVPEFLAMHVQNLRFIALAVELHCKRLDEVAKKEKETLKLADSVKTEKDAKTLRGQLVIPILGDKETVPTMDVEIQYRHVAVIYDGLGILAKNLKASKGINGSCGNERAVEQAEAWAVYIEKQLQPRFNDQGELLPETPEDPPAAIPVDDQPLPPPPPAAQVEGMRSQAEALAEG